MLTSRALLDVLAEGIVVHAPDGSIVDANDTAPALLGLTRDQLLGRTSFDPRWMAVRRDGTPIAGEDHPASITLRTGQPLNGFVMGVDAPGRGRRWLSVSTRLLTQGGSVVGVGVSFLDMSDWLGVNEALAASEARYRLLAEHASDLVLEIDDEVGITWVSPSVERLLGHAPEQVLGRRLWEFVAEEDQRRIGRCRARIARGLWVDDEEMRIIDAAGDRHWMGIHARPITDERGVVGAVVGLRERHWEVLARRAAATLSAGSAIVAEADDEDRLLAEMCEAAVSKGGYQVSCYARPLDDGIELVAFHTAEDDVIAATLTHCDRVRDALRLGHTVIADDLPDGADQRLPFRSSATLPVRIGERIDGVFTVYAAEPRAFDERAVTLLEDLTAQIGTGLARIRAHRALEEAVRAQALLTTAIDQASDAIVVTDTTPVIRYANPSALRSSGRTLDEVVGRPPWILQAGLHEHEFFERVRNRVQQGQAWSGVVTNRRKDGEAYEEDVTITPVRDEHDQLVAFVAVKRDLTIERRLEADLHRELGHHRAVKALMHRVRPGATLEETAQRLSDACCALDDIDNAGLLLVRADGTVTAVGPSPYTRAEDAHGPRTVAAYGTLGEGSDRPLVLDLRSGRSAEARASFGDVVVDRMVHDGLTALAFIPVHRDGRLVAMVGLASRHPDGADLLGTKRTLFEELGTFVGTVVGDQVAETASLRALRMEIREIIATRRFFPVYQPVVDLRTGTLRGYEALTRFADGARPDHRFRDAHEVGLGSELEAACAELAITTARRLPHHLSLSLNFSPTAILSGHAVGVVDRAERPVVIEITEHVAIESYARLRAALQTCRDVRVSVDDAGAGYASLRHILELRPDVVKLDIGIVGDIDRDPARQALVAGLVHFASRTDTEIVAEGVETQEEAHTLIDLGVPFAQGNFFGPPAPLLGGGW